MSNDNTIGTPPQTPNNRAGYLFAEETLRKFLAYQFDQIHKTIDDPTKTFIEELFHKFGTDVVLQVKQWWRETTNLPVFINFPRQDISLPLVAIVNAGEGEKSGEQYLGDHGGEVGYGETQIAVMGDTPRTIHQSYRQVISLPMQHTLKVYLAANDPTLVLYLNRVVYALLLLNKIDFDRWTGVRNMTLNSSDIEHHPELFPEFAYFKVITMQYDSNFDVPLSHVGTIGGVNVTLYDFMRNVLTQE